MRYFSKKYISPLLQTLSTFVGASFFELLPRRVGTSSQNINTWIKYSIVGGLLLFFLFVVVYFLFTAFVTKMEGFNNVNSVYTYYPKKVDKIQNISMTFYINDFIKEAIEFPDYIKVYKEVAQPIDTNSGSSNEYSTIITETPIYLKYTNDIQSKEKELMDAKYGDLFKKETFINKETNTRIELTDFKKIVEHILSQENKLHNFINFSIIRDFNTAFSFTEFSDYFANLIYKYKDKTQQLVEIQTFLYKLLSPLYLHSKWMEHFISNPTIYTKKDDILYILNTTKELLTAVKIEDMTYSDPDKNIYILKDDTENAIDKTLSVDSLTLFSMLYLLLNIYPLTQQNRNKYIQISNSEIATTFKVYLKKKYPETTSESILAFACMPGNEPSLVE
jgi:hypothetical protein